MEYCRNCAASGAFPVFCRSYYHVGIFSGEKNFVRRRDADKKPSYISSLLFNAKQIVGGEI
jgi:hypothetical protein